MQKSLDKNYLDRILNGLITNPAGDTPFSGMSDDVGRSRWRRSGGAVAGKNDGGAGAALVGAPEKEAGTAAADIKVGLTDLIDYIELFRYNRPVSKPFRENTEESDIDMYNNIKTVFDNYITNHGDKTIYFDNITIDMVVRPGTCEKSNNVVKSFFNNNKVHDLEYFYRPILLLVMLLYMNKKQIPEDQFFYKTIKTGVFQETRVSLYNHLVKKRDEQGGDCKILFEKLINVYNFVYPGKSNLAIRIPAQEGARRTRYRKRKGKARARKTRRS